MTDSMPPVPGTISEPPATTSSSSLRWLCSQIGILCFTMLMLVAWLPSFISWLFVQFGFPFGSFANSISGYPPYLYYGLTYFIYLFCFLVPLFLFLKVKGLRFGEAVEVRSVPASVFFPCVILAVAICLCSTLAVDLSSSILEWLGVSIGSGSGTLHSDPVLVLLSIVAISVIAPIVEEFFFRGVILSQLKRYGNGFAVVVSALLFSAYHMSLPKLVFTFCMGIALGYIMVHTRNIVLPILVHSLNNLFSQFRQYIAGFLGETASDLFRYGAIVLFIILGVISLLWLLRKRPDMFVRRIPQVVLSLETRTHALLLNPGILLFFAGAAFNTVYRLWYH